MTNRASADADDSNSNGPGKTFWARGLTVFDHLKFKQLFKIRFKTRAPGKFPEIKKLEKLALPGRSRKFKRTR